LPPGISQKKKACSTSAQKVSKNPMLQRAIKPKLIPLHQGGKPLQLLLQSTLQPDNQEENNNLTSVHSPDNTLGLDYLLTKEVNIQAYTINVSISIMGLHQTFGSILLGPVPARATPLTLKTTLRHLGFDIDFDLTLFT